MPDASPAPSVPVPPAFRFLTSRAFGWTAGILATLASAAACTGDLPWPAPALLVLALGAHLAARAVLDLPRVGFPACVVGVSALVVVAGLFRSGIAWTREWESLRNAGSLPPDVGGAPWLGLVLSVALGGAFLALLFLHAGEVWRALGGVRMAVTTLSAITVFSMLGTMVVQRLGAGGLAEEEQAFVEKFMKGQGGIPVNARFLLSGTDGVLDADQERFAEAVGASFGEEKGRHIALVLRSSRLREAKAAAIAAHVEARHENLVALFDKFEGLGFTAVFRTWWFNALLVLLCIQVAAVMAKRFPWNRTQVGWVMTHAGVVVILIGCLVSDAFLRDGSLGLMPGETRDRFEETTRGRGAKDDPGTPLDFHVGLLGADETRHHELVLAFPTADVGGWTLHSTEPLRPGRTVSAKDPDSGVVYEVRVAEAAERADLDFETVPASEEGRTDGVPGVRIGVRTAARAAEPGAPAGAPSPWGSEWLLEGEVLDDRGGLGFLRFHAPKDPEAAARLLSGEDAAGLGQYGRLSVRLPDGATVGTVGAGPGAEVALKDPAGVDWTVQVERFEPSFWIGGRSSHSMGDDVVADKPVLRVRVRKGADGPWSSTVVYADPDLQKMWESMQAARRAPGGAAGDPHATDPHAADPHAADPHASDPHATDPHAADPHAGEKGSEEPAAPKLGAGPAGECSFQFDYSPPRKVWLVRAPSGEVSLVVHTRGAESRVTPLAPGGDAVPLGTSGLEVRLEDALPDAVRVPRVRPLLPETDEEYLAACEDRLEGKPTRRTLSAAKIEIRARGPEGEYRESPWLVAAPRPAAGDDRVRTPEERRGLDWRSRDGRFGVYLAETEQARMFRSAVEVRARNGQVLHRQVVRVNQPLHWGGYAFYQNSFVPASAMSPEISVFRVKYDRGVPIVYTGFLVLTVGVMVLLYWDPAARRRRAARAGIAVEPDGRP